MMIATLLLAVALELAIFWHAHTRPRTPQEHRTIILDRQHIALHTQQGAAHQALRQAVNATEGNPLAMCATPSELAHAQYDQAWAMPAVLVRTAFNVCLQ